MKKIAFFCLTICPWFLKKVILRFMGFQIGKKSYIGFSFVYFDSIELGSYVYIGHFNLIKVKKLKIDKGGKIGAFNWITGASSGNLILGEFSSIRRFHFLECSGGIRLGKNTIIAGRGSQFFTHGLSSTNLDVIKPILIGDWCYIGSNCSFVPGIELSNGIFVGMGSVVTKSMLDDFVLYAGSPARKKKELSSKDIYFDRAYIIHKHLKGKNI